MSHIKEHLLHLLGVFGKFQFFRLFVYFSMISALMAPHTSQLAGRYHNTESVLQIHHGTTHAPHTSHDTAPHISELAPLYRYITAPHSTTHPKNHGTPHTTPITAPHIS